jgi:hypothetical protein
MLESLQGSSKKCSRKGKAENEDKDKNMKKEELKKPLEKAALKCN